MDDCYHRSDLERSAAELVARAQQGDHRAFGELVQRYRPRIFALALHLSRNESEADDITQEVFIQAYRALPRFAGKSAFFTWLYRMTVNRSLSTRRAQRRRRETTMDDPRVEKALAVDAAGDPVRAAELRGTYEALLRALDRMPAEMRTTVVLVALQGLSHGEAAVVQACSPGTIAWRIHEARGRLRRALHPPPASCRRTSATAGGLSQELRRLLQDSGFPVWITREASPSR
jgi:RNA polymerase sigma-70 factor (ECF subfamily)